MPYRRRRRRKRYNLEGTFKAFLKVHLLAISVFLLIFLILFFVEILPSKLTKENEYTVQGYLTEFVFETYQYYTEETEGWSLPTDAELISVEDKIYKYETETYYEKQTVAKYEDVQNGDSTERVKTYEDVTVKKEEEIPIYKPYYTYKQNVKKYINQLTFQEEGIKEQYTGELNIPKNQDYVFRYKKIYIKLQNDKGEVEIYPLGHIKQVPTNSRIKAEINYKNEIKNLTIIK